MPNKKKILHIIQSLESGGCENMLLRTLPLLDTFDHAIVTLKEPGELAPEFVSAGIAVETVHCDNLFDIAGIQRLRKLVREKSPQIILTYLFHADMLGRLALPGITRAPIIPFLRTTYNHRKYFIARILEWLTKPLVKRYLANSEAVKAFYVNNLGVRPEKITVIQSGMDISVYENADESAVVKELGLPDNRFIITCVANLNINKGYSYLLEAFESVFQKHPESYLIVVGDGPKRDRLKNQTKDYQSQNKLLFLGQRTDVPDILKASDCFILPTLFEGMSNAILEAMAAGLPIITTDIPENRVLIENEKTGFLVPVENSAAIAQALERLIINPGWAESLGNHAREKVSAEFSLKAASLLWTDFLLSLSRK